MANDERSQCLKSAGSVIEIIDSGRLFQSTMVSGRNDLLSRLAEPNVWFIFQLRHDLKFELQTAL